MTIPTRVPLADVLTAPIALTTPDAVAVIVQLAHAPQTGRPRPISLDASQVWLERSGAVTLAPGLLPRLSEFAALLDQLLSPRGDDVPRGLQSIVVRARDHGAAATIPSLSAFAAALAPFQPSDPAAAVRALVTKLDAILSEAPTVIAPHAAPEAVHAATLPAALAPADPVPPSWHPTRWHIAAVAAATVLAAVLGGALGRSRDATASSGPAPAGTPAITIEDTPRVPHPEPQSAPVALALPAVAPVTVPPPAAPAAALTAPPPAAPEPMPSTDAPRLARLVDRRDAEADAVFSPSFAANGSAVFFHAESSRGSALKRADSGDGELRVASIVDDGARNYHVQLSPDGTAVAFDSDRDGVRGVYLADAEGRGVRRISGPGHAAVPTWSPDGRQLALIRAEPDRPAVWNLWRLDRDSGRQTRVTSFRRGQVWGGAWFADGRRIAYSHEDRLTIHDLETGRTRDVASPVRGRMVRTPAVSPDGRWIVFQVFRDGVWLFGVEDGAMRRVLEDATAEEFAWSPDGRKVAYHSRRSGGWNLWTMAAP